ncbi:MAG: Phenylalanyl-tRNA synthetase beta chain [uncultured Thermomicrobiales bacterium]|uniref:Phenylalanine--tRNA ligase beta subunit n=1 Tax=uncultured Thermomicrobiales bacterium TaxID=1645740 RepID=A0A6J4VT93_9BACT|nr:MAG: Phenylalanyl-tRNA synthetase beta chain [uncultured Thermomicrobiales bacterium]
MKVPYRWLSELVATGLEPAELARRLTMAGLEAEKIETIGAGWENVFVGLVRHVARHPDADRLVLAEVDAGEHHLTVVTGAPNIAAGQTVALALAGARLIDAHGDGKSLKTLKPGTIRGVRSEGMVCSEKELGISEEHEGIMVLEPEAPVGAPLADWLGETIVEFEITPNLVHAFSVLGIAREAAALTAEPLRTPPAVDLGAAPRVGETLARVEAPDLCPRCTATIIEGVTVGPSPGWLTRRLAAAGLRSINNVVDVTNYVMLEWGQPLHAYDRDRLAGGGIVVRRATPGEALETLDGQRRVLDPEMLVIADAARAVGVAGVMGGLHSEVEAQTRTILLEAATFAMGSVRRTSRALRLRSDASARFERGLDPNLALDAAGRAAQLILDLCPGSRVTAVADVYPDPVEPAALALPFGEIERLLGVRYETAVVLDVLSRLGFAPEIDGDGPNATLRVRVPTYRHDVTLAADVVEEVARVVGYDTLPETLPTGGTAPVRRDPVYRLQREVRRLLVAGGGWEAVTYVAAAEEELARVAPEAGTVGFLHALPTERALRLRNPIQSERGVLRPTLLPALLAAASENRKHEAGVRLFELARVYLPRGADELPREANLAGIVLAGRRDAVGRFADDAALDFFDLKGMVEAVVVGLGVLGATFERAEHAALHPGRAAALCLSGERVGLLGELRPDRAAAFGLEDDRVCVAELDLDALLPAAAAGIREVRVPRFLPVEQDFAVVVAEEAAAGEVEQALLTGAGALATRIALFDVYRGPQVGEGRKSLAYRVTFTAPDRALTDAELGKARGRIGKVLKQRVGGELRG